MVAHFISLQWKAFFRSASLGRSIGLKIVMGFLALYFSVSFLILGVALYPILKDLFPEQDPVTVVNQYLLLWLGLEFVLRFMLQTLPVMNIKPLLVTPIPKKKVVNYVLTKSLFSFYNLLPMFLFVPFAAFSVYKGQSFLSMFGWTVAVLSLSLCVNYANFLLKKKFADNLKELLPYLMVVAVLAGLEYFGIFSITEVFGAALDYIVAMPFLALIPVLLVIGLYVWNQKNLLRRFYLDESLKGKTQAANTQEFLWVRKFGDIAPFLQLDLKLIWRNKRPKTTIWMSLLLVSYGLIFYPNDSYADFQIIFVFVGIFMTGIFMINFGQFIPAWDASYFSMMMSQNIPLKKYLASKIGLMTFSVVVLTILTTPYVYFGYHILILNLACAVYNIGVNVPVLLYAGSFNRKRIDLEKSPFMNYQGTGAAQWIVGIPLMVLPVLIFWGIEALVSFNAGIVTMAGLGILGLLLRKPIMDFIELAYKKNKYAMVQGFKQTGE